MRWFLIAFAFLVCEPANAWTHGSNTVPFPVTSGLNFHVRAQDIAQSNLSVVSTWADTSGNGYDLTQSTTDNKPIYATSSIDNLPAVVYPFTVAPEFLSNASYPFDKRASSILVVASIRSLYRTAYLALTPDVSLTMQQGLGVLATFSGGARTSTLHTQSGRRVAILFTFGASASKIYMDASANVQSFSALASGSLTGLQLGDTSGLFSGGYYEVVGWNRELSGSEAAQLLDVWAPAVYGTGLSAATPVGRAIFDGDSITEGTGATLARNWSTLMAVAPTWATYNFAVSGNSWANIIARQAVSNVFAASGNWLFIFAGTNDLSNGQTGAQIETSFQTYMNAAVAAGFDKSKMVAFTLSTNNTGAGGTARDDFNAWLRLNYTTYAGFLVDLAADSQLGVTGSSHNDSSLWVDGAHYNEAGYVVFAAFVRSTIPSLPF
jgi:lysophospholipase L1-like esterase